MTKSNKARTPRTVMTDSFGGIDRSSPFGVTGGKSEKTSAYMMSDFRLCADGSIEKRCGISHRVSLPSAPRAVRNTGAEGGVVAAIGNGLYSINPTPGTYTRLCTLGASTGDADFFYFDGELYMLDGISLKKYSSQTITEVNGYVPLYGKNWDAVRRGQINEPLNLLSLNVRIMYDVGSTQPTVFHLGLRASSVDGVEVDGVLYGASFCSLTADRKGFSFTGDATNCKLTVRITLDDEEYDRSGLLSCTRAATYGGVGSIRIFAYGGTDRSYLCHSVEVSDEAYAECAAFYPRNSRLYFPTDNLNHIGDGRAEVTAICRHFDRLLIFTENETWMADCDTLPTNTARIIPVNSSVGCTTYDGAVLCGDTPVTLCDRGVFRWSSDTYTRTECSAKCVSLPVAEFLTSEYLSDAVLCACPERNEVAVFSRSSPDDCIWIYNVAFDGWYCITGASAYNMFGYNGEMCFIDGEELYLTDESEYVDTDELGDEHEIIGRYESNYLDTYGDGEAVERCGYFCGCLAVANTYGGDISIGYITDRAESDTFTFGGRTGNAPEYFFARGSSEAFGFIRLTLEAGGEERAHVYRLAVKVR